MNQLIDEIIDKLDGNARVYVIYIPKGKQFWCYSLKTDMFPEEVAEMLYDKGLLTNFDIQNADYDDFPIDDFIIDKIEEMKQHEEWFNVETKEIVGFDKVAKDLNINDLI